jgi:conjugative relaxase-like TrwC/TraI family protein
MLRTHWLTSSSAAKAYFRQADYYASSPGEWLGKGAEMLGLYGPARAEDFDKLCDNIDPRTDEVLRPYARDGERVGMDFTFNSTKSVGLAREMAGFGNAGDPRIEEAHREAVKYAMGYIEADMSTRVRGGRDGDRVTGNLVAYRVTHRDTRISAEDQMPDMELHDHVFVLNTTYDPVEDKWKACQIGEIKHDAPYYEAIYHNRLASNLRELGYGVRRDGKAFEINGITRDTIERFSRRRGYIKAVAAKLGITSQAGMDKLGATTRLGKAKELADDLNGYYVSRLTKEERKQFSTLLGQPSYESSHEKAVEFAIGHEYERRSVIEDRKLYETALRHGIGSVTPDGVEGEAKRQGLLVKEGLATTKAVLAEEQRVIAFAREGKGAVRPLDSRARSEPQFFSPNASIETENPGFRAHGAAPASDRFSVSVLGGKLQVNGDQRAGATLSPEQLAIVSHVLTSTDQVTLVVGDAGTGKTHAVKTAFEQINCPVEMLAPSASASRGVLRDEGFAQADTVASFLFSEKRQEAVRGGVIWVDEAGLLAIKDLSRLTEIARDKDARIVLQGDPKQHKSVVRHGNMLNVLQEFAGLPVGRLTEIWRQKHKGYKALVADIAKGEQVNAFDQLQDLGWVQKVEGNAPLVDDYFAAESSGKTTLIVAPTHVEGHEITEEIRGRLTEAGKLKDERIVEQLVPLNWSEAERGDVHRYQGTEVMQFHRNSGTFKAGDKVRVCDWRPGDHYKSPAHFSVYEKAEIPLAAGDLVRFTANGKTADKKHDINNGSVYRIDGFDKKGNLILENGWTVAKDFKHLTHGYVTTSVASQGKSVDRVLIAMGSESRGAINAEQFYVSVSRGKESAKIYTDMPAEELKQIIQRSDPRKSATEVFGEPVRKEKPKRFQRLWKFLKKARQRLNVLQQNDTRDQQRGRQHEHDGQERGA